MFGWGPATKVYLAAGATDISASFRITVPSAACWRWAAMKPRPTTTTTPVVGQPQSSVWFGKTDDLWSWGRPQGWGGPWRNAPVQAALPSDPFLFTGFERKALHLIAADTMDVAIEIDFLGNGTWVNYETVKLTGGKYQFVSFPDGFSAHWVRLIPSHASRMTAEFMFT